MKLVATKSFSYNTRRLKPGDLFEAKDPDGRLLIGVRKARYFGDREENSVPAPKKGTLDRLLSTTVASEVKEPATMTGTQEVIVSENDLQGNDTNSGENGEIASQFSNSEIIEEKDKEEEVVSVEEVEKTPSPVVTKTPARPVNRRGRARKN